MDIETVKKILTYIDEHIHEKISLAELAEVAGYSPFYFSKLFSEIMGMPVTGYIRIRKLQHAVCSLIEGKKVLEVSFMYAFDSHEGFTRSFTQLFGSTPSTVKRNLTSYHVPEYHVPSIERNVFMESNKNILCENMHQLVFEVIKTSLEEAEAGYCSKINITMLQDGKIKISDNGRGIPLSKDKHVDKKVLDKILAGHPITNLEYAGMGDFSQCSLQTVNSLCESLQVNVYRNGTRYQQDYVRGIAQHDVMSSELEHTSGTEIIMKPDTQIFGDLRFSAEVIEGWIKENIGNRNVLKVTVVQ